MVAERTHHEGGCYCGAIRYRISGDPSFSAHCHCRSCQRALGGAFVTWAVVARENFEVVRGVIKTCEKTTNVRRGFCGDCGTTLTYATESEVEGEDWSKDAWFTAASLDYPAIVTPKNHVYVSHKQPWITLNDGLPCFEKF